MKFVRLTVTLTAAVALAMAWASGPAGAHGGEGVLTVESSTKDTRGGVRYVVRLTWEDDGHPAVDATVTAVPFGPAVTDATPLVMGPVDDDGRYQVSIPSPGDGPWEARFTSVTPTASIVAPGSEVPPPATSTTTTSGEAATTSAPTTAEAPATTDDEPSAAGPVADGTSAPDADSGSDSPLVLVALAVAVMAVAAGLALVLRRRNDDQEAQIEGP
jgi:hypothetical protein